MLRRIRPLSVAIFVAVLMLSVRLGHLWQDLEIGIGRQTEAQGAATKAKAPPPVAGGQPAGAAPASAPSVASASGGTEPPASSQAGSSGANAAASGQPRPAGSDADAQSASLPVDFSDSEIGLLQNLAQRREELARRARDMDLREGLLKAAEKRLDDKIAKLGELQATLQDLLKQYDAKTDAQLQSLVKIYETMKPKDAARIWDQLDLPVLLQVVEHMREQKAALILAAMNPETAKKVTDELIRRRQLPGAGGNG